MVNDNGLGCGKSGNDVCLFEMLEKIILLIFNTLVWCSKIYIFFIIVDLYHIRSKPSLFKLYLIIAQAMRPLERFQIICILFQLKIYIFSSLSIFTIRLNFLHNRPRPDNDACPFKMLTHFNLTSCMSNNHRKQIHLFLIHLPTKSFFSRNLN